MDFKEKFKNNKIKWFAFLIITIIISVLFPTQYDFAENKSKLYLFFITFFSCILFIVVYSLLSYLIRRFIKRRLNDSQIEKEVTNVFIICWLIQIIKHFII